MLEIQRMKMLLIHNNLKDKVLKQEKNKDPLGQETNSISNTLSITMIQGVTQLI